MVCDEKGRVSDCRGGNVRGIPRLENRDTWGTRVKRSRTVSAVRQATSRKAREVAYPQLFRSMFKDKPALYSPVKVAHPPGAPSFACFSRRVGGSLVAHETCAFTSRALALERIGSIAAHPFDSAQGRLWQKTQGWGTHSCVIGEETKTEGWDTRQVFTIAQSCQGWWRTSRTSGSKLMESRLRRNACNDCIGI